MSSFNFDDWANALPDRVKETLREEGMDTERVLLATTDEDIGKLGLRRGDIITVREAVWELQGKKTQHGPDTKRGVPLIQRSPAGIFSGIPNDPNELRIVLFGKTGSGKSATGNTILGEMIFEEVQGQVSGTVSCRVQATTINGRKIKIVDTPGVCDTHRAKDEVLFEVSRSILFTLPGPHVLLFVIRADVRFTKEEYGAYLQLKECFAAHLNRYIIVVFTRSEDYFQDGRSLEEAEEEAEKEFKQCKRRSERERRKQRTATDVNDVLKENGNRYVLFCNRADKENKDRQVLQLLEMIDRMISENNNPYFQDEKTLEATKKMDAAIKEIMRKKNVTQQAAWEILQKELAEETFKKTQMARGFFGAYAGGLIASVAATIATGGLAAPALLAGAAGAVGGGAAGYNCSVM